MHTSCIRKTMVKIQIKISRKVVCIGLFSILAMQLPRGIVLSSSVCIESFQTFDQYQISYTILMENKQVYGIRNITSSLYYISTKQFSLLLCCLKVPKSHPILFFTLLPCPAFDRVMQFGANGDQQKQIKSFNFLQWRSTHSSKHNVSS